MLESETVESLQLDEMAIGVAKAGDQVKTIGEKSSVKRPV